jgi:hypothetical protein
VSVQTAADSVAAPSSGAVSELTLSGSPNAASSRLEATTSVKSTPGA